MIFGVHITLTDVVDQTFCGVDFFGVHEVVVSRDVSEMQLLIISEFQVGDECVLFAFATVDVDLEDGTALIELFPHFSKALYNRTLF